MIKKMMALLAAISCAIGAWADVSGHLSGTDFSGLSAGPFVTGLDDSGQSSGTTYWFAGDPADIEGSTIVSNSPSEVYLDFESNIANPLYRTISSCAGASSPSSFTPTQIGTGLFIDTHVQFTPYLVNENHSAPTGSGEDKLIVWVRETESVVENEPNLTNLIVTAGYYGDGNALTPTNYEINLSSAVVSELCSHTNRLTIKAFESITGTSSAPAGFVVYLNETALEYTADAFDLSDSDNYGNHLAGPAVNYYETNHRKLFPSLVKTGDNKGSLSCVGYAGMGRIDDVIFDNYYTDYPAFAGDPLTFTVVKGEGVASYVYGDQTYTADQTFPAPSGASVIISNVVYTTGWKHKKGTWYNGTTIVSNEYDAVTDTDYGTFVLANGNELHLVGFQANYLVGSDEYQTLFGGTITEPEGAITVAARTGATFKLTKDTVVNESGNVNIVVDTGDVLVIDLNGHTLRGSTGDDATFTIVNIGGSLTVTDNSAGQTGAVLGSIYNEASNALAIQSCAAAVTNKLEAGTFEIVEGADVGEAPLNTGISGGKFLDLDHVEDADDFYLQGQLDDGFEVVSWDQVGGNWYATIGSSGPTPPSARFPQSDTAGTEYAGRTGTPASPFVIRNYADLVLLKEAVAEGEITTESFEVVSNITGVTEWVGIGTDTHKFEGTLNGNGKTIDIAFAAGKYNGLFCYINNATISNLTVNVTGVTVSDKTGGAAFVGNAYGVNVLTAIKATGSLGTAVNRITHNAGGLVAYAIGPSASITYNSCTNAMDVYSTYTKLGGFLGWTSGGVTVTINNGVNLGNLDSNSTDSSGNNGTGGLIGWDGTGAGVTINGATSLGTVEMGTGNAGSFYGSRSSDVTFTGVLKGHASEMPIGGLLPQYQLHSLDWATVDGDVATFVTPVATVDSVVAYKVMQANSSPNFTLAAAAASLTIDTSLAAYTGTVSVDSTLSEDYNLRETAIANGTIYSLVSKTPSDPWAPTAETDEAAAAKIADLFPGTEVASKVTTYAMYTNLVDYIKGVTSSTEKPDDITDAQEPWLWKSYILGANPLFVTNAVVAITSLDVGENAGEWDFIVKVTEGELTTAHSVAAAKVAALVKVTDSLSPASWSAPDPDDVHADLAPLLGTNLIKVTVDFGTDTSGFMKVSEE